MTTSIISIEVRTATILVDEGSRLFEVQHKEEKLIDVADIEELVKCFNKYTDFGKIHYRLLSVSGKYTSITKEAREYGELLDIPVDKEAVVIYSLAQRIVSKFYFKFRKANHPTSIFDSRDKAIEWLFNE